MVTSKSTVLGLRLDHDRRAWVEAEAARRGVTVRVLFEGLIDGAQAGRSAGTDEGAAESATAPGVGDRSAEGTGARFGGPPGPGPSRPPVLRRGPTLGPSQRYQGDSSGGSISLPVNILKTSGRYAHKSLEGCPALRSWSGRSG